MEKVFKIKAFMDDLRHDEGTILDKVLDSIPYKYEDDVYEFELVVRNVKDISEEVGIDEEGCRNFSGIEIKEVK